MKNYGKHSSQQWRKNLQLLEAIYGSQKEASKKLGVSPSTYRAYKTGKATPSKDKVAKANRLFGHNKKRLKETETKKRVQKKVKETKQKREQREKQLQKKNFVITQTKEWINGRFERSGGMFVREAIRQNAPVYFAHTKGNSNRGQFITPEDVSEERIGKPSKTKSITIYGLYTNVYIQEIEKNDLSKSDFFIDKFPMIQKEFTKEWTLEETLDYLEAEFFSTIKQVGRRKYNPTRFIGYEL